MILEFKFRNFRSAKDWQILSFEASADKVSEEYYCTTINDTKVLKLGILYGANASGKTNVLLALDFIRKIAISPKINKMQPIGFTPFLLDDTTKKECGVFELTFFVNNMNFSYNCTIFCGFLFPFYHNCAIVGIEGFFLQCT